MPYGPAARVTDLTSHGSPLAPGVGSTNVLIGSKPAWRALMDFHACPIVKGVVPDVGGTIMVGSPTVLINSMMACRVMDIVVEIPGGPNPVAMGATNVCIGDIGVVAPSVSAPAIPISKALVASLASMPAAAAAQRQALIDAAKAGVPYCEKCQHLTDGQQASATPSAGTTGGDAAAAGSSDAAAGPDEQDPATETGQANTTAGTAGDESEPEKTEDPTERALSVIVHDSSGVPQEGVQVEVTFDDGRTDRAVTNSMGNFVVMMKNDHESAKARYTIPGEEPVEFSLPEDFFIEMPGTDQEEGLRRRLHNLGYFVNDDLPAALVALQATHGLPTTGAADQETCDKLSAVHDGHDPIVPEIETDSEPVAESELLAEGDAFA